MTKEILKVKKDCYKIPKEYKNKKIEILIFPLEKVNRSLKAISLDTRNFKFNREKINER